MTDQNKQNKMKQNEKKQYKMQENAIKQGKIKQTVIQQEGSHNSQTDNNTDAISSRQALLDSIATQLLQARQAKKQSISKPVHKLKIPINHLRALESGNWDHLPDDVYVIGFLRQYSTYLELDLGKEIDRLKNNDYSLTRPLTFPDPPVAPSRRWAWISGGAFVLLFILFNIFNSHSDDENNSPTPASSDTIAVQTVRVTPPIATPSATIDTEADTSTKIKHTTAQQTKKPPLTVSTPTSVSSPIITPPTPTRVKVAQTTQPKLAPQHRFRFEAVTAPVWIQIFAPDRTGQNKGRLIKEMLLKKGHHSTIRQRTETLWITCGNALALRIRVDKKIIIDTGELGEGKKVLRDYRFDLY